MKNKLFKLITISLAVTVILVGNLSTVSAQEIDPNVEQKLSIMSIGELATLDSMLYNDTPSSDMIGQIFEGLYRVSTGSEVELGQAEKVDISEDGLTYTFTLRDGLVWSNGDPVTAEDYVFTYQRLVDPNNANTSSSVEVFKNASKVRNSEAELSELGVTAPDEKTLVIELEYPAPYLPKLLTGSRFMPVNQKVVEEKGQSYGTSTDAIAMNGPFLIEGWEGTSLEWKLVKNPNYWDAENVFLDEVQVSVVKETGTGADLFDAGELDYTILNDQFVGQYTGAEFFHQIPKATIGHLQFNATKEPTNNIALRRAILQAIDKDTYTQSVIQDGSTSLNGFVPSGFDINDDGVDYREEAGELLTYNVEAAQKNWETAKEELGKDQIELQLLISDSDLASRTAEYIQAQLMQNLPGLTITIRSVPLQNRLELQRSLDFDFFYGTWAPDYQDAINFVEQMESDGGINFGQYSNEKVDQLIDQARNEFANDPHKRRQALIEAEKIAVGEEASQSSFYQASTTYLLDNTVEGFEVLPFGRTINLRTTYRTAE
ncbi:peptide ABC transporter substrate-binding protein [Facklamia miroungae]|uniref:Oligopeptide transport system substrate-binding protein n=1 Tax=Facklamia miroungae TaxID=120956 RepID=A0A1G7SSQ3_9LACT|nr:peptide ABC transporter substrate-binding protein [Facklamia miroungae]NKZ29550.1 peptide ABC transporter substrate-binding protein [Facklamia miroungae]SDG26117.1 oligopeptide transport system substrate-binding protein [Facklamia miroungae]